MKLENIKGSYTSADTLPVKLLRDDGLINYIVSRKKIPPIHVLFMFNLFLQTNVILIVVFVAVLKKTRI